MSLLGAVAANRRARREASRSDPVTLEEFGYLLGSSRGTSLKTKAGITVGPQRALGLSAWWRGVSYLTTSIAGLPCFTFRDVGGRRTRRADPAWRAKPDIETPWYALIEFWMMSELHRGNAYAYKLRDSVGRVVGLRPLHPDRVVPGRDPQTGMKVFKIDGRMDAGYTSREILHIPALSYDGVVGLNPIQVHAESLGLAAAADEYADRAFGQGSHLRAYISMPQTLDDEEAKLIKAQWTRFHSGMANAHELGVLGNGAEYKTVDLTPEQAQLLETRKFSTTVIGQIIGLPPHKLYDLEHATFSNIEHQAIEAVTDGVMPWVRRLEEWIRFDPDLLPAANFLEFQIEGLLRGDIQTRYGAYGKAITDGWMMPAEPRHKENLEELDGTKFLVSPLNMRAYGPDAEALPSPPTPRQSGTSGATA